MAQALIRNIADLPLEALKSAARAERRSLEALLREVIEEAGRHRLREQAFADARRFRETLRGRWADENLPPLDTAELVREGRAENDVKWE